MDKEQYIPEEARKEKKEKSEAKEQPLEGPETASVDYEGEEKKTDDETRQIRKKINNLNSDDRAAGWNLAEKQIILPEEEQAALNTAVEGIKKADRFAAPALFKGNKTATEYDSKACNFSTQTNIVELPDGRKIFVVHNYKSTGLHRWMDGAMKHLTGYPMRKATRAEWKGRFEEKSNLPTIPLDDPEMVALPFVPNVNLDDLFCRQQEIKNFGECDFAKDYSEQDKLAVLEKIAGKVKELHGKDVAWGELILANIIIDKNQDVHICDPEVAYDEGVPLEDQKAYDLLDLITSACTSMEDGNKTPYDKVVDSILKQYDDSTALGALKKLAEKKMGLKEKLFFGYSKARLRLKSPKQFDEIKGAILAHLG
jgi:tRNA A-37 threonylcarbamoyl transferase component Bud32